MRTYRLALTAAAAAAALTIPAAGTASAAPVPATVQTLAATSFNSCGYVVNTNGVRFRTGPGTSYSAKGLLYKGDWGYVTASSGSWYKMWLGQRSISGLAAGTTGWVYKSYLSPEPCTGW